MSTPVQPGSRTGPALEQAAQDTLAATRPRPRFTAPPGYEPVPLSAEERAEAQQDTDGRVCGLCAGYHHMPSTAACPRLASFDLDGEGKLKSGTFWPGTKWAKGRVVFKEDTLEDGDAES